MRNRVCLVLLFALLALALTGFQGVGGKIPNQRTLCLTSGSTTLGPINIPSNIPAKSIQARIEIAGYPAPGETAALRFNGDTGNNYSVIWATWTGAAWAAGTNTAAATDRIRIGPADTQQQRIVVATIHDNAAKTEHMVTFDSATGTGSTTNSAIDVASGKWISASPTAITSLSLVTTNANMGSGSCMTVSW
jgi:hypothetical protein